MHLFWMQTKFKEVEHMSLRTNSSVILVNMWPKNVVLMNKIKNKTSKNYLTSTGTCIGHILGWINFFIFYVFE